MTIETLGAALEQINRLFAGQSVTGFSDSQLLDRFVAARDGQAFEALVARHGPLVLNVCRGILKDPSDAEDAFQATFLILVKKSGTFRGHVALGPWLYQVAHRVAIRASAVALRRRVCERRAGEMAAATSKSEPASRMSSGSRSTKSSRGCLRSSVGPSSSATSSECRKTAPPAISA